MKPGRRQPAPTPSESPSDGSTQPSPDERPAYPHTVLTVRAWIDPVVDNLGHDPRSGYAERFWLAVLGPSCLLLLRRLSGGLEQTPDGFELVCREWAAELGLGMKGGKHGPFWRAVERACRFRAAQRNGDLLVVRRRLPPLSARQVERLPDHLRDQHRDWLDEQLARPRRGTLAVWNPERFTAA